MQDCLNLGQHLQPRCLEDRFLPQHTRNEGTAEAHSLQHIISNLPAVLRQPGCSHLLTKEIHHHTSKKNPAGNKPSSCLKTSPSAVPSNFNNSRSPPCRHSQTQEETNFFKPQYFEKSCHPSARQLAGLCLETQSSALPPTSPPSTAQAHRRCTLPHIPSPPSELEGPRSDLQLAAGLCLETQSSFFLNAD